MRILLDECLPKDLAKHLVGHDCQTVPKAGFAGKANGELLVLAERAGWKVLLTMDQGIPYQQTLANRILNYSTHVRIPSAESTRGWAAVSLSFVNASVARH